MRHFWLALVLSAVSPFGLTQNTDIDDKIMALVVEPCLAHAAEINGILNVISEQEAVDILKASNLDQVQTALSGTAALIQEYQLRSGEQRQSLFENALNACKQNNLKERELTGGHHLRDYMQNHEAYCYQDIDCWYRDFQFHVGWACEDAIQIKARGSYAWTDWDKRWSKVTWGDNRKKTVRLTGNYLKTPNRYGQYTQRNYTCIFDRDADVVARVSIR